MTNTWYRVTDEAGEYANCIMHNSASGAAHLAASLDMASDESAKGYTAKQCERCAAGDRGRHK